MGTLAGAAWWTGEQEEDFLVDAMEGLRNAGTDLNAGYDQIQNGQVTHVTVKSTPAPAGHGAWLDGADVMTFHADNLHTELQLDPSEPDLHQIHVAFPITTPDIPAPWAMSHSQGPTPFPDLPYWGFPMA